MKVFACRLLLLSALPAAAQMAMSHSMQPDTTAAPEKLGPVTFAVSCSPAVQAPFNRGVALLHDFWYAEAQRQFEQIETADPSCAMAHWGVAMSHFHQIWDRPGEHAIALSWAELQKAQAPAAKTERERAYIAALSGFFEPGKQEFPARIQAYSGAMGRLYAKYPDDIDAGAFYALSLLAASAPDDTSLGQEHKAMAVLTPLFARYPDHPGVLHYIIHSCDNPVLASHGLAASDHYGEVAPSGAHAFHMPGHIYARLGMWPQDIAANLGSVAASESAEGRRQSGLMDEPHSYDFLLYAYLQSGQDARAKWVLDQSTQVLNRIAAMPEMGTGDMRGMVPYYRSKLPIFYALEMRDWKSAAALEPPTDAKPEVATLTYWARTMAAGRLHQPEQAQAGLAKYDSLMEQIRNGKYAYMADGTGSRIERGEMAAWVDFAKGDAAAALQQMRATADLQDKVGQGEVDIPAREMLGDMLLEFHRYQDALKEYEQALKLSPNRFNGLYNAGFAAERTGDRAKAQGFYTALLKTTENGSKSTRPELAHTKAYLGSTDLAVN